MRAIRIRQQHFARTQGIDPAEDIAVRQVYTIALSSCWLIIPCDYGQLVCLPHGCTQVNFANIEILVDPAEFNVRQMQGSHQVKKARCANVSPADFRCEEQAIVFIKRFSESTVVSTNDYEAKYSSDMRAAVFSKLYAAV